MFEKMCYKLCVVVLLLTCCANFCNNAALTDRELKNYQHLIEGQGLYTPDDDVTILTESNFREQIYGKKHAIFVEFYNSWCGHCQRFAPSWKALGTDIKNWSDMIIVAVIDCSDSDNSNICRSFDIGYYPTLRYLHEDFRETPENTGLELSKGDDFSAQKKILIKQIIREQREGRGEHFPNVLPYTYRDATRLFVETSSNVKFVFVIVEEPDSLIAPQVAFDLHTVPEIAVRYVLSNNTAFVKSVGISKVPSMLIAGVDGSRTLVTEGLDTRESARSAIGHFLKPRSINIPDVSTERNIYTGKWVDVEVPTMEDLMEMREREKLKQKIKLMGDVVMQADLEMALRNSLKGEVALHKKITGEHLQALTKYLDVLVKYFPFGKHGQDFLRELRDNVASGDSVNGVDIEKWVGDAEKDSRVFSSPLRWLACQGSSSKYRGYPCGMWKMFHFLTVAAAEQNIGNKNAYPREVLDAMHGYIKNFFGCDECSKHFQHMAVEKGMNGVNSLDSAVLWLWMAHNTVNKRLAGDPTEDPEYPKIQFPSLQNCPTCRTRDNWNYQEVLQYLKLMYSSINVRYIGSDTKILHAGLEGTSSGSAAVTPFFKNIDASMCFILYVGSFCLIMILIRLFLKRGYKKKMYVHDLLGKV